MEILNTEANPSSMFASALPSLKLGGTKKSSYQSPQKDLSSLKPISVNRSLEYSGNKVIEEMPH